MKPLRIQTLFSVLLALLFIAASAVLPGQFVPGALTASAAQTDSGFQYIVMGTVTKSVQITGYNGYAYTLTIPSAIDGVPVTSIKSGAFKGRNTLLSVTIPDTVKNIGDECFSGCTLLGTVELGKQISTIGDKAFENCAVLGAITIPAATSLIGDNVFYGCKALSSINVTSGNISYISNNGVLMDYPGDMLICYPAAHSGTEYTVPGTVKTIDNYAFYGAKNLKKVTVTSASASIGKGAFKECTSLEKCVLPTKLVKIEDEVFSGCKKLNDVSFAPTIRSIGSNAFKDCTAIPALTIPASVTTVGTGAFAGCTGIASVTINPGLTAISGEAFSGCSGIKEFKLNEGASFTADKGVLLSKDGTRLIAYPAGSEAENYTVGEKVTAIGAYAFDSCKNLKKLVIPATVKTIVDPAVRNCSGLVIHAEEKSEAQKYFQTHTSGFSALKIGSEKPGDVNGDGEVDNADAILVRRYVAKWQNISIHPEAADVNKDGEVDNADVILLRRYVAGWKTVTLK